MNAYEYGCRTPRYQGKFHRMTYVSTWLAVAAFAVVAAGILGGMIVVSWIIRPSVPELGKSMAYESGEPPTGTTRIRFNIQYYMVGLLFLIFDVETAFIVPWVVVYRSAIAEAGIWHALLPMLAFIGTLLAALIWAWRIGALRWVRTAAMRPRRGVGSE